MIANEHETPFWKRHRDGLLVTIVGTTIGTVLAAAIVFVASSLAGLLDVSSKDVGAALAYAAAGLVAVVLLAIRLAEQVLRFQVRRARAEAQRAEYQADAAAHRLRASDEGPRRDRARSG